MYTYIYIHKYADLQVGKTKDGEYRSRSCTDIFRVSNGELKEAKPKETISVF